MGLLTSITVKKFEFHKSKMAGSRHFENRKIAMSLQTFDRFLLNLPWQHGMLVLSVWRIVQIFDNIIWLIAALKRFEKLL